jgi:hypothetical protein
MSNYVPTVRFETEFEGDIISMELRQLTRKTFLDWTPFLSKMDDEGKLSEEDTIKMVNVAADILPEYVSDFKGLKDANGNPISIETVSTEVYFMDLVSILVTKLMEISQVGKGVKDDEEIEKGKSEGQPPELSTV